MNNSLNTYNYFYKKTYSQGEMLLKKSLQNNLNLGKLYDYALREANKYLFNKINRLYSLLMDDFPKSASEFLKRKSIYKENQTQLALENNVYDLFIIDNQKLKNEKVRYSYFVSCLAQYDALNDLKHHFGQNININLYKKMFNQNKLDLFIVADPESNPKMAKLYKKLGIEQFKKSGGETLKSNENSAKKNKHDKFSDKDLENLKTNIESFNEDEKYLLLHYIIEAIDSKVIKVKKAEFVRIMCITNHPYDPNIFLLESSKSLMYLKTIKGMEHYTVGRIEKKIRLKHLIDKLDRLPLKGTTNYFRIMRDKL